MTPDPDGLLPSINTGRNNSTGANRIVGGFHIKARNQTQRSIDNRDTFKQVALKQMNVP